MSETYYQWPSTRANTVRNIKVSEMSAQQLRDVLARERRRFGPNGPEPYEERAWHICTAIEAELRRRDQIQY